MVLMARLWNYHSKANLLQEHNLMDLFLIAQNPLVTGQYWHTASFGKMSQVQVGFRSLTEKSVIYSSWESGPAFW